MKRIEFIPSVSEVSQFIENCNKLKVLVIGDLMLDRYLWGKVERISPEAPVPIVDIDQEENRLGGAANVALNVHALGATPILCGVIGSDRDGATFRRIAREGGFDTNHLVISESRRTTVKIRIIGNNQQVLRVDREDRYYLDEWDRNQFIKSARLAMKQVDVIIFEDYDKGLLDPSIIATIIQEAKDQQIPVAVDPKFKQFLSYHNCTLFKPNLKELNEGLNLRLNNHDLPGILDAIKILRAGMPHSHTLVTLSEAGMLYVPPEEEYLAVDAHYRNIIDVSGAGDTVISIISLALATGTPLPMAAHLANLAGGMVCEEVGVVPVNIKKLKIEAEKIWNYPIK